MFWQNIASMYRFIKSSWRRRGFQYTINIAIKELWFEWRYGVETIELVALDDMLDIDSELKAMATKYQATYVHTFQGFLDELNDVDYENGFLDLGCGKGRALMLAVLAGFKWVAGVEFSEQLVEICEQNISTFSEKTDKFEYDITLGDAGIYHIPDNVCFIYMANPFSEDIIKSVLKNIDETLARKPRPITIGYTTPIFAPLIAKYGYKRILEQKDPQGIVTAVAYRKN